MTKRINWILILQAWAMLWVVIGHSFLLPLESNANPGWEQALHSIAYSFHMSLKEMSYLGMILDKIKRLFIPFVVFTLLAMVFKSVFSSDMGRQSVFNIQEFANAIFFPYNGPLREMWFIFTIFWLFALRPLWKLTFRKKYLIAITIAISFTLTITSPEIEFLCLGRAFSNALWFYLGMWMERSGFLDRAISGDSRFVKNLGFEVICILLIVLYALSWLPNLNVGIIMSPFRSLLGIAASISLAIVLDKYVPSVFKGFRDYTYQLFLMGIFFQIAVKILFRHNLIPGGYLLPYLICILVGIYCPVLVSMLVKKINWRPLGLCIGISK